MKEVKCCLSEGDHERQELMMMMMMISCQKEVEIIDRKRRKLEKQFIYSKKKKMGRSNNILKFSKILIATIVMLIFRLAISTSTHHTFSLAFSPATSRDFYSRSDTTTHKVASASSIHPHSPPSGRNAQPVALPLTSSSSSTYQNGIRPVLRTVNPGDRVNIPCSLADLGGSIQFAKDDQPIVLDSGCAHCQLDISNDGQASLTISRVSSRDQGHWQCWRLDASGKVKQKIPILQLEISNSPELPILIVNDKELLAGNNLDATITVKENELVTFKCLIRGAASPVDYVHWMLDSSQNVSHLSQLMMEYSPQENNYVTQSLLKLNVTKSMNLKSVSCLSNHQLWLTPMTVTAFLNVLYEPSFTISREPGFGYPVTEGMTVILKCEIDSNPSSSPIWIKDADNKTASSSSTSTSSSSSSLTSGSSSTSVQQQQQQVALPNTSGKEPVGEPIVLETQEDGSVIFQPAQRSDSGWYRCKTENKYGNFSSFGYYLNVRSSAPAAVTSTISSLASPSSVKPAQSYGSALGRVLAPNQAITSPTSSASLMDGGMKMSSGRMGAQTAQSSMMNNDQPDDGSFSGRTTAQHLGSPAASPFTALPGVNFSPNLAQNQQQFASSDTRCKGGRIDGSPSIDQPVSTVNAVLGRQLILHLRFCCNPEPARLFWIHRHLAMIPGRMFGPYITREIYTTYNSFYCYESTFEIESVKPEDIGTIYVFVSNEKGHAGAQIHIQLAKVEHQTALGSRFPLNSASAAGSSSTKVVCPTIIITIFSLITLFLLQSTTIQQHIITSRHRESSSVYR